MIQVKANPRGYWVGKGRDYGSAGGAGGGGGDGDRDPLPQRP